MTKKARKDQVEPRLIPAHEAAPYLHCHEVTMRRYFRDGTIPGVKIAGRWFVSSVVLDRLLRGEQP